MFDTSTYCAADVMTRDVVSVRPDDTVRRAAQLMLDRGVSGLPVIDAQGHLVGFVSEADLVSSDEASEKRVRRWLDIIAEGEELSAEFLAAIDHVNRPVSSVMRTHPITVGELTPLNEVASLISRDHVRRVIVVEDGKVTGIVARRDLVRALAGKIK
jgi:CBS domain-containing protein